MNDKKYESLRIPAPGQSPSQGTGAFPASPPKPPLPLADSLFYELEVGPGERSAPPPQKIEPPVRDPVRNTFAEMRAIARQYPSPFSRESSFFNERTRFDNARVFYNQAQFMSDFEDSYEEQAAFSAYFPHYQMMGYEQLRTYFTWRTRVRRGEIGKTSLSYAFLYMYELLNNIGVRDPKEGLDRLCDFWRAFRAFDASIDKYFYRWLKDYYIYYPLEKSFQAFARENDFGTHYPGLLENESSAYSFELFCAVSKYDITKSAFFAQKGQRIVDCFGFVIFRLRQAFQSAGLNFDDAVFQPTKGLSVWVPFKDALFNHWLRQPDRRVVFSQNEIYLCNKNKWSFSTVITMASGRQLVGYVMRQTESVLREVLKYKHKLSANMEAVDPELRQKLAAAGLPLDKIVRDAVLEFHREATKTVVSVDERALNRIRQEALATQEKLVVAEDAPPQKEAASPPLPPTPEPAMAPDGWASLRAALSEVELRALAAVLREGANLKQFADANGVMPEVLADGINEKAADFIGDSLLDDDGAVYDDYKENVKGMVGA